MEGRQIILITPYPFAIQYSKTIYILTYPYIFKFFAQMLQRLEKFLFQTIFELQNSTMQSKFIFVVALVLKFFLKEGFILLFLLMPIGLTADLLQIAVDFVGKEPIVTVIATGAVIVVLVLPRIDGLIQNKTIKSFTLFFLPWVDIVAFPTIFFLIQATKTEANPMLVAGSALVIVLYTLTQLVYNLINFTKSPKSPNLFNCRQARLSLLSNFLLFCFCFYFFATWAQGIVYSQTQQIVYSILLLSLSALKFNERILMKYAVDPYAQSVNVFMYLMQFNLTVFAVANSISQLDLIATNLPYLLIVTTVLAYWSKATFKAHQQREFYLSSANQIKGETQAMLYIDCLEEIARKIENEIDDIVLVSLRKRHQMECASATCFCNFAGKQLGPFMKQYVNCELDILATLFSNNSSILISILYFKMVMFKSYQEILTKLNDYRNKFHLSVLQRFYAFWLSHYVRKYINKRNQEMDAIESEEMFRLELLKEEMEEIIRGQVQIREKKWKYLSRGLCRIEQLEDQCEVELTFISRIMKIYEQNKIKFKKSKQFNLLLLFYFLKISFLNNGKELRNNLKEIYYGFKTDELRTLKEFKKFIYHKGSCAIETLIDPKNMGKITTVSKNIEDIFGVAAVKAKGTSINSLMPQFMGLQHEEILSNWFKNGTWKTIGKLKEIYCVHKEEYCFSALLYLKIYFKEDNLYFITNIFKLNDADYLILSPEGKIQGMGRKFVKVFGDEAKQLPLHVLIQNDSSKPEKEELEEGKVYRRVFMGLKGTQQKVSSYRQQEESIMQLEERESQDCKIYSWLKESCQTKYFVEFIVHYYQMGRVRFPILQIRESRPIEKHKTSYFLAKTGNKISSMRDYLGEEIDLQIESAKNIEDSQDEDEPDAGFQHMANSSMASLSQKQNYPLTKMVEKFVGYLIQPRTLSDSRILKFTLILFFLFSGLIVINFLSYFFYRQLLLEVEGVFFADGAVSDIMQTTEIAYAHVYQLRSQLLSGNFTDFQSELRSARYVQYYVYSLQEFNFAHLISDTTQFANKRLYKYIQEPATWTLNGTPVKIDTYQFLQHMYYLTYQMVNQLQKLKNSNQTNVDTTDLKRIVANFPEMKHINEYFLLDYENSAESSIKTLDILSISSMALFGFISLGIAIAINSYYKFRFQQSEASFKFLSMIPNQLVERLKEYYANILQKLQTSQMLKHIDRHEDQVFAIDNHDLGKVDQTRTSSLSKIKLLNYSSYYKWTFIVLALIAINALNYLATTNVRNIFDPSKKVISYVNSLMRGQNRLLEAYFDMKATYYLDNPQGFTQSFFDKVQNHLDGAGQKWSSYANELSNLLISYSPDYQTQFRAALITNVCTLTQDILPAFQVQKCTKELKLNMLDGGIMISMNFFKVVVQEALETLKAQYVTKSQAEYNGDYFRQQAFTELDKMEIYMFKIYQYTQDICYRAFINIIDRITGAFLVFMIIFLLLYVFFLIIWLHAMSSEKEKLSRLYGRLILVPFVILKSHSRIVNSFKEAIEFRDS